MRVEPWDPGTSGTNNEHLVVRNMAREPLFLNYSRLYGV